MIRPISRHLSLILALTVGTATVTGTQPAVAAPQASGAVLSTNERDRVKQEFARKDAAIANLRSQLEDAQNEIDYLKSKLKQFSSLALLPTTRKDSPVGNAPKASHVLLECKDVEIHSTYVVQYSSNTLVFTGTLTNVGNSHLNKIDVYCHMLGWTVHPNTADYNNRDRLLDSPDKFPEDWEFVPTAYRDIYGDTYRSLKPGESRQISIVVDLNSASPFVNIPEGKIVYVGIWTGANGGAGTHPNPSSITLVPVMSPVD